MSPRCSSQRVELRIDGQKNIPTVEDGVRVETSTDAQDSGAGITSLAECTIPLEWKDESIIDKIDDFDPDSQSSYSLGTVFFQDVRGGGYSPVFRGFVRGVSGGEKTGTGRVILSSPDALATAVPVSASFERPTVKQAMSVGVEALRENTPFNPTLRGATDRSVQNSNDGFEELLSDASLGFTDVVSDVIPDRTTFKSNRHTVADLFRWVCENTNAKWYTEFRYEGTSGLSLVYDPGGNELEFTERELLGDRGPAQERRLNTGGSFPDASPQSIDVLDNDVLKELFPINTLILRGETGVSILGWEAAFVPGEQFPLAEVSYPPLVKRAGGTVVSKYVETRNVTIESATNTAKSKLAKAIRDSGTGTMTVYGKPQIRPYDRVTALPSCNDVLTTDVPPLTYEVAKVVHEKKATSEYTTTLTCAPVVDESKITVDRVEMKDA